MNGESPAIDDQPRPLHKVWLAPVVLLLAGVAAFSIDVPVSRYFHEGHAPGLIRQVVESAETFGHGLGVLFILLAVAVLDPARRPSLPRLAACSWAAGIVVNVIKMTIARTRPHRLASDVTDVWATFDRWLPLWTSGHGDRSFPSAHTASAFGLALGLAVLYPRGRAYFLALAALCGLQRIECSAHYASDVCIGAAVGWVWASFCLGDSALSRTFDTFEAGWEARERAGASAEPPDGESDERRAA